MSSDRTPLTEERSAMSTAAASGRAPLPLVVKGDAVQIPGIHYPNSWGANFR